jgi:hypothetical protein
MPNGTRRMVELDTFARGCQPLKIKETTIRQDVRDLMILEKPHLRTFLENLTRLIKGLIKRTSRKEISLIFYLTRYFAKNLLSSVFNNDRTGCQTRSSVINHHGLNKVPTKRVNTTDKNTGVLDN